GRSPRGHACAPTYGRGGDPARDPAPGRLCVLDRELVAASGRGRRADGDLRRDDRAGAPGSGPSGRPRALHRAAGPSAGGAAAGGRRRREMVEERTEVNARLALGVAFGYGGRAELVEAARRIAESGPDPREIDENVLAAHLYAPELPDPDLLIRTSGELRVSNFMLWQLAYAELVFADRLWPAVDERDLRGALGEYAQRRRRFGGR